MAIIKNDKSAFYIKNFHATPIHKRLCIRRMVYVMNANKNGVYVGSRCSLRCEIVRQRMKTRMQNWNLEIWTTNPKNNSDECYTIHSPKHIYLCYSALGIDFTYWRYLNYKDAFEFLQW